MTYPYIIETLEVIAHKLHLEKYPAWKDWDGETRKRASSLLQGMASFNFLIVMVTTVKSWFLRGPTKKLQGCALDLYDVVDQIREVQCELRSLRENAIEDFF